MAAVTAEKIVIHIPQLSKNSGSAMHSGEALLADKRNRRLLLAFLETTDWTAQETRAFLCEFK
jgi:hypothetical protein